MGNLRADSNSKIICPRQPLNLPWYTTTSYAPYHKDLFKRALDLLLTKAISGRHPPFLPTTPKQLRSLFDFTLNHQRSNDDAVITALENLVKYSPNPAHPLHLGKDQSGVDSIALLGDFLTTTMSTLVVIYTVAPVLILQEEELIKQIRNLVGYPNPSEGDGTISADPGVSAIMALQCAIFNKFKTIRDSGCHGRRDLPGICVVTSETGSPYWEQVCAVCGLGLDALVRVEADESGRINVNLMRNLLNNLSRQGKIPIMIVATLGTDPHGAIDPLEEIGKICLQNEIWFHIDGDYGGPLIFCDESFKSSQLRGLEHSDSFMLGCTGMLGVPYSSSILVTKHPDILLKAVGLSAKPSYVFQKSHLYSPRVDNGDHSIQTNRRGAVNSLWLMWKVKGRVGLGKQVHRSLQMAKDFRAEIKARDNFQVASSQTVRVLFYYKPPFLLDNAQVGISRQIKTHLVNKGGANLGLSTVKGFEDEWFAVSVANPSLAIEDLRDVLRQIEDAAEQIFDLGKKPRTIRTIQSPVSYGGLDDDQVDLIEKAFCLFQDKGIYFQSKRDEPVLKYRTPEQLHEEINMTLTEEPQLSTNKEIVQVLEKIIDFSLHQGHPLNMYHVISTGIDPHSMIADYFAAAVTSNCQSFEDSPVYSLMEEEVCLEARKRIGFPKNGDGVFLYSGSLSVFTALYTARANMFPETVRAGVHFVREKLVAFMSANAHYCLQKAALAQGIGFSNVVLIPVDSSGALDVELLRKAIVEEKGKGNMPFYVQATAGTTVLGRFDPIKEIAKVCRQHQLWLHVDGSLGGGYLFSERQVEKLKHVEWADSMNFNIHKTLGLSHAGSVLLFRHAGVLDRAFAFNKTRARNHSGVCWGRRPDVFKFWLTWKAKGIEGFGLHVDYTMRLKAFALSELKKPERQEGFVLHKEDFDCVTVCFYYLPKALRHLSRDTAEFNLKLDAVAYLIQKRMFEKGIPIGPFKDGDSPHFLKMHLMCSGTTERDVIFLLDAIEHYCYDIEI